MQIFTFFGSILGYVLWFLFSLVQNFGIAVILFTLVIFAIQIPFFMKQQKSSIGMQKVQKKMQELQAKYAGDRARLAAEQQKLYDKEGVKPTGGCLTMIVPFIIMFGLIYSVAMPLTNTLHIDPEHVAEAKSVIEHMPGYEAQSGGFLGINSLYGELEIVKNYDDIKGQLTTFTPEETQRMELFSKSFSFLGMNLLDAPTNSNDFFGQLFHSNLFIIPLLSLLLQLLSQFIMNKMQPGMQQQMGCMKIFMYLMSLYMAYFAAIVPAAVGVYYIVNSLLNIGRTVLMHKFYSPAILNAQLEASHVARMELDEAKKRALPADVQSQLEEKLKKRALAQTSKKKKGAAPQIAAQAQGAAQKPAAGKQGKGNSADSYMGKKK